MPLKSVPNFLLLIPTLQVYFFLNLVLIASLVCVPALPPLPGVCISKEYIYNFASSPPLYNQNQTFIYFLRTWFFFFIPYYVFYLIHMEYRTRDFYILRLGADGLLNSFYFHLGFFVGFVFLFFVFVLGFFFFLEIVLSPANFISAVSILMPFIYFSYLALLAMTAIMLAEEAALWTLLPQFLIM